MVLRSYFYGAAGRLRFDTLVDASYAPLSDRVGRVLGEEHYHLENAQNWLDRLAGGDSRDHVQDVLDRPFPRALSLLVKPEYEDAIIDNDFRTVPTADLHIEWLETVVPYLGSLGFDVPEPNEVERPSTRGRDGTRTDHWDGLAAESRRTYDEFEALESTRIGGGRV